MAGVEDEAAKSVRIRELNDAFRMSLTGGQVLITRAVSDLSPEVRGQILFSVQNFAEFNEDNDPHGEHDMGKLTVAGSVYWFKIDYYDHTMEFGSEDASDPEKTNRVLTIMTPEDM